MNDSRLFQRLAGISAIFLTVMTAGNVITLFASTNNNVNALVTNPALLLTGGARGANHVPLEHGFRQIFLSSVRAGGVVLLGLAQA